MRFIIVTLLVAALGLAQDAPAPKPKSTSKTSTAKRAKSTHAASSKSTASKPSTATAKSATTKPTTTKPVAHRTSKSTGKSTAKSTGKSTKKPVVVARRWAQQQPTPDRYKEIQQALAERGYFRGDPDGTWGPESVDSLKRFQHDQSLTEDGKIGSLSLIALGLGPRRSMPEPTASQGQ